MDLLSVKTLFGDSLVYGFSKYLWVLSSVALTPVYTRLLSKEDFGVMDIFNTWNMLAGIVLPLGLVSALLRFYPEISDDEAYRRKALGTIFSTLAIVAASYTVAMLGCARYFQDVFIGNREHTEIYYHGIFLVVGGMFASFAQTLLQAKLRKYRYMAVTVTGAVVLNVLGFAFVYYQGMGVVGFFRASSVSMACTLAIGYGLVWGEARWVLDMPILRRFLAYSIHLLSVFVLFQATNMLDRFLIREYCGLAGAGVYALGSKVAGILQIAVSSFALAWFPRAMRLYHSPRARQVYKKVHDAYFMGVFALVMGLLAFRQELIALFAPGYGDAYALIGLLALYNITNGANYIYPLGLHVKNKTQYLGWAACVSIVVNALASICLLRWVGLDGVAWGTLAGGVAWILVQLYYSQKHYPVAYNFGLSLMLMTLCLGMVYGTQWIEPWMPFGFYGNAAIKLLGVGLCLSALYFFYAKKQLANAFQSM